MKKGLFKRIVCIAAAVTAISVCDCSAFASVKITSSNGNSIEVSDSGAAVIRKQNGGIFGSCISKGSFIEKQPEEEEAKTDFDKEETTETTEAAETAENSTGTDSTETSSIFPEFVCEVVNYTNIEREKYGLPLLEISEDLTELAQYHADDMYENNYFSHSFSDGSGIEDKVKGGYNCLGENIAQGYSSAEAVVEGWMNSEGHRANILNSSYTEIGVGCNNGYWVQIFRG
ncbi:MAG: CAP domain-containing protein [Clostridiales bacterium]|nr:CAP domain-containing protein [Clostridiales bacterium]